MPSVECAEELEILESIYKEIKIEPENSAGESVVSLIMYPATAGDAESRYVTITLELRLPNLYPEVVPEIQFRNPRGVSEDQLSRVQADLGRTSQELVGSSMLYQLIDLLQDFLTANNKPSSECPICLMAFSDFDVFYTPACYHHFHSRCLGVHLQNVVATHNETAKTEVPPSEIEKLCPVCRVELGPSINIERLLAAPPPSEDTEPLPLPPISVPDPILQQLYEKQRDQGGIIDLTDSCKRLLVISSPAPTTAPEPNPAPPPPLVLDRKPARHPHPSKPHHHVYGGRGYRSGRSHGHGHPRSGEEGHRRSAEEGRSHGHGHIRSGEEGRSHGHGHGRSGEEGRSQGHGHTRAAEEGHRLTHVGSGAPHTEDQKPNGAPPQQQKPVSAPPQHHKPNPAPPAQHHKPLGPPAQHQHKSHSAHSANGGVSRHEAVLVGEPYGKGSHHAHHPRRRQK